MLRRYVAAKSYSADKSGTSRVEVDLQGIMTQQMKNILANKPLHCSRSSILQNGEAAFTTYAHQEFVSVSRMLVSNTFLRKNLSLPESGVLWSTQHKYYREYGTTRKPLFHAACGRRGECWYVYVGDPLRVRLAMQRLACPHMLVKIYFVSYIARSVESPALTLF
jgi:hypothetical protein